MSPRNAHSNPSGPGLYAGTLTDSPWTGWPQAVTVFALCVFSRLYTTIHYIEDADSLRFALAMIDFDVTKLQPQFPGYPVFCFFAKILYLLTGSYATAFSLLGGVGLFVILHYSLALLNWRFTQTRGFLLSILLVFNPMLWILGNRYMTDLSGAACALAALYHLTRTPRSGGRGRIHAVTGFFLVGIQAGWRLSFVPFLLVPLVLNLFPHFDFRKPEWRAFRRLENLPEKFLAGSLGVFIWLIPLIAVTGWTELWETSRLQTSAHFLATGGTYHTESDWGLRAVRLVQDLWIDGLGTWWPGRHPVTLLVSVGAFVFLFIGCSRIMVREIRYPIQVLIISCVCYAVWIYFFQNVVNQTRHVLPLLPLVLMAIARGLDKAWTLQDAKLSGMRMAGILFLLAYGTVGVTLALQHKQPAAIAQARNHLVSKLGSADLLIGAPWVLKCLTAQGVYLPTRVVDTPEDLAALRNLDPTQSLVTVGNYTDHIDRPVLSKETFYHNPYVNRLGSKVEVIWYGPAR